MSTNTISVMTKAIQDAQYMIQDKPVSVISKQNGIKLDGSKTYLSLMYNVSNTIKQRYGIGVEISY